MKLTIKIVMDQLKTLCLKYDRFFEENRIADQAAVYLDTLEFVDERVFLRACKEWEDEKFPNATQLLKKCNAIKLRWQTKAPAGAQEPCRYTATYGWEANEGAWSRSQCRHWPMTEDQTRLSVRQFGVPMCYWHEQVLKSKIWPEGVEVEWTKAMETDSKMRNKAPVAQDRNLSNVVVAMYNNVAPE